MVNHRVAQPQRLAWLEGIRIFAVVMLLLYHAQLRFTNFAYTPTPTGVLDNLQQINELMAEALDQSLLVRLLLGLSWFGFQFIDVFILVTGFSLIISLNQQVLNPVDFLKRRLMRILWPFWTVAWIACPVLWALAIATQSPTPNPWRTFAGATFPLLFSYDGELLADTSGPWWLLSLLISFILIFPILWHFLKRWGAINLLLVSCVVTLVYRFFAVYLFGGHPTYVLWDSPAGWQPFSLFVPKLSTFVLGMVVGHAFTRGVGPAFWPPKRALLVGAGFYLVGFICQFYQWGWIISDLLLPIGLTLGCMVVFRSLAEIRWLEPWLITLGLYSYAFFLVHGFVIDYTLRWVVQGNLSRYSLMLPFMVVGSLVLAVLVEYVSPLVRRLVVGLLNDLDYVLATTPFPNRTWDPQVGDEVCYRGEAGWRVLKVEKLLDEQDCFLCQVSDGQQSLWVNEDDLEPAGDGFR